MKPARRGFAAGLGLLALLGLTGCLGHAPAEQLLRLPTAGCQAAPAPDDAPGLALRPLESLPGLARSAVLLRTGKVLNPSQQWSFEAPPADLLSAALRQELACAGIARLYLRENSRSKPAAVLSGQVTAFEVLSQDGMQRFSGQMILSLWDGPSRRLLAERTLDASEPMAALTADAVATAAAKVSARLTDEASAWLATALADLPEPAAKAERSSGRKARGPAEAPGPEEK